MRFERIDPVADYRELRIAVGLRALDGDMKGSRAGPAFPFVNSEAARGAI